MLKLLEMTNATKALIIAFANAIIGLLVAFDVVLTETQQTAILVTLNAGLALWVGLTFQYSHKRIK